MREDGPGELGVARFVRRDFAELCGEPRVLALVRSRGENARSDALAEATVGQRLERELGEARRDDGHEPVRLLFELEAGRREPLGSTTRELGVPHLVFRGAQALR